jgi:hypothetical protein
MIDEARAEKALCYLEQTDAQFAESYVMRLRTEYLWECAEALVYQHLEGSVEDRKRGAKVAEETRKAHEEYLARVRDHEFLKAKRKRAELIIEVCRSLNSARKAGLNI